MPAASASRQVWNRASPSTIASQPICRAAPSSSSAAPQADGHHADGLLRPAHHLQPLDREELLQPLGKVAKRERFGQPAPSARALTFRVRHKCRDAAQAKPGGQTMVHRREGRIERRVRTVDRDPRGDQIQQQSADRGVCRQPLDGAQTAWDDA